MNKKHSDSIGLPRDDAARKFQDALDEHIGSISHFVSAEKKLQRAPIAAIKFNKTIFSSLEANNFQLHYSIYRAPQYATLSLVGV